MVSVTPIGSVSFADDGADAEPEWTPIPQEHVRAGGLQPNLRDTTSLLRIRPPGQDFTLPPGSQTVLTRLNVTQPEMVPDNHVACLDVTMFMMVEPERWDVTGEWVAGDGAWQAVGRHMRFQPFWLNLAEVYLRRTFGVAEGDAIPPVSAGQGRTDF